MIELSLSAVAWLFCGHGEKKYTAYSLPFLHKTERKLSLQVIRSPYRYDTVHNPSTPQVI